MSKKTLGTMSKQELQGILKDIKIDFLETDTNATLEQRIVESGRYITKKESSGGKVSVSKDGKRVHKTLGEYIKVRVHPTAIQNQKTSIFCSINLFTIEFHPNEIVSIPKEVAKYLKGLGEVEYYYDANVITENGNKGAHMTRMIPKYIVEVIDESLEN
jgi:hypothetical protein